MGFCINVTRALQRRGLEDVWTRNQRPRKVTTKARTIIPQCGALPFLIETNGEVRVLLITTRGSRRWTIPKGWPIRALTSAATAAREAFEEAGVVGSIVDERPVGSYRYEKRHKARDTIFEVSVFLFAVKQQLLEWPEKAERATCWFSPVEASGMVDSEELGNILITAISAFFAGR
jgi:8-oxo-dGTP pyrophosphatase MutT (NUDIX family)